MLTVGSPAFQKASRPPQDRTMVVACLAEVAQDMGPPISSYIEVIIRKKFFFVLEVIKFLLRSHLFFS